MSAAKIGAARPRRRPAHERWVMRRDVVLLLAFPLLLAAAWTTPRGWWPTIADAVAGGLRGALFGDLSRRALRLKRRFGWDDAQSAGVFRALAVEQTLWLFEIVRMNRPGAAPPPITLEGDQAARAAVADGRGAIFWWCPCVHRDLIAKIALARAGFDVVHLSRQGHGLSASRLGRRLFNPLLLRQEDRFLKGRAVINPSAPVGAALQLQRELKAGGVVALAAARSQHEGVARPIVARFLNGRFRLAPGAVALALRSGAPLYPVMTLREGDGYRVVVGPDLSARIGRPQAVARAFAAWNAPVAARTPGQWSGWLQI